MESNSQESHGKYQNSQTKSGHDCVKSPNVKERRDEGNWFIKRRMHFAEFSVWLTAMVCLYHTLNNTLNLLSFRTLPASVSFWLLKFICFYLKILGRTLHFNWPNKVFSATLDRMCMCSECGWVEEKVSSKLSVWQ